MGAKKKDGVKDAVQQGIYLAIILAAIVFAFFFFGIDWMYHDEKQFFLYESEEFKSDSFELGFRLGYAWDAAKYEFALWSRNLLDEEIVRNGIDFNNLTGFTNDPRIIGVEFLARF